jgi:nucleoside-diphosphate-sugar epimerase
LKLVLFGANGATGRLLTRVALDAGHSVLAVTRRPDEFPLTHPRLTVAAGDIREGSGLATLVDGVDAVLSTVGVPFTRDRVDTYSVGAASIIAAMRQVGVRRLVVTSSQGAYEYPRRRNSPLSLRMFEPIIRRTIGKTVYEDTRRMEDIVRDSGLDWTIVRPAILFDLPKGTNYIAGQVEPVGVFTARIDLANYLINLAGDAAAIRQTVVISTTDNAPVFWRSMIRAR